MIPALSHPVYTKLVRAYVRLSVRGHFNRVWLHNDEMGSDDMGAVGPTILYATHVSWWDGYLMLMLSEHLGLEFRVMMLSRELSKYQFLRYTGAFGIDPNSAGDIRASLRYASDELLLQPARALVIFPAGEIRPFTERPLLFKPGVAQLAHSAAPVLARSVAIALEHRQSQHPEAFLRLGQARQISQGQVPMRDLLPLLQADLSQQADALATDLRLNQFENYKSIVSGVPGVNQMWDFLRGKAKLSLQ